MVETIVSESAVARRLYWIDEIVKLSGHFGADSSRVEAELVDEIKASGSAALLDHLRLCSAIPESYGHDSSEEKLYSKYTDALLASAYRFLGLRSMVLTERADAADVEAFAEGYSFVADAKVFRLSRTAKNQKDFKVQAMDGWKRGKPYAMVVCPLYQLPSTGSQIYEQASTRSVCIFSYSHLAVLVQLVDEIGHDGVKELLHAIFKTVELLNPSKDALQYWRAVNAVLLRSGGIVGEVWKREKLATIEGIKISKNIALEYLARERENICNLSHDEAIKKLLDMNKIDNRVSQIKGVRENTLMNLS
jgi:type II restriction enzyme